MYVYFIINIFLHVFLKNCNKLYFYFLVITKINSTFLEILYKGIYIYIYQDKY